jgi:hypothetical protein
MTDLIWSFAPWFAFLLFARFTNIYGAAIAGAVAAIVVLGRAISRKRIHLLDIASTAYFIGLGVVLLVIRPGHLDYWSRYAQAGAHAFLTLLVLGSVALGHPFTESYAREMTPREIWETERFHSLNRRISLVWGLAFLVGTASLILAGSVGSRQVLLRIIVPFGTLFFAYKYTEDQRAQAQGGEDASN